MAGELQVRFFTKLCKYSVPDTPFNVPASVVRDDLSLLINSLLSDVRGGSQQWEVVHFDFLIGGEFLCFSLEKHLELKGLATESIIDVEYVERQPAPGPENSVEHDDWVSSIHASEHSILSGSYDTNAYIWSKDFQKKLSVQGHGGPIKAVSWIRLGSPVSTFVTASYDQTAMIWDWNMENNTLDCRCVCRGHERSVECVAVNQDGTRMATGSWDRMLKIWSTEPEENNYLDEGARYRKRLKTETGKIMINKTPLLTLSGHGEAVSALHWTAADEICTASWDHTIRIWNVELGGIKQQLAGNKNFLDISYSPLNQLIVSASADRHIRLWDVRVKGVSELINVFSSHNGWVTCVRWSSTNEHQFISGSQDWKVKQWDTRSPKVPLYDLSGHKDIVLCCDWSDPQYILSGGSDNYLRVFRCDTPDV